MNDTKTPRLVEEAKKIGSTALWQAKNGLSIEVKILDVRMAFGKPHYIVAPVAGSGQARIRDDLTFTDRIAGGTVHAPVAMDQQP